MIEGFVKEKSVLHTNWSDVFNDSGQVVDLIQPYVWADGPLKVSLEVANFLEPGASIVPFEMSPVEVQMFSTYDYFRLKRRFYRFKLTNETETRIRYGIRCVGNYALNVTKEIVEIFDIPEIVNILTLSGIDSFYSVKNIVKNSRVLVEVLPKNADFTATSSAYGIVPIEWDLSGIDFDTPGDYSIVGTPILKFDVTNTDNIKVNTVVKIFE